MTNPTGYFKYILAMDCETTGLKFNSDDPSDGHQALSWGLIVADAHTLKPVEELYVEIKWNAESLARRKQDPTFGIKAESIHGLTFNYLEEHGVTEEEAVIQMVSLIMKYFGTKNIRTLGHNVATFDIWFMKRLTRAFEIPLKFGSRNVDTSTIGFVAFETYTSDQLFDMLGFDKRKAHNALDDAKMSLAAARQLRVIVQAALDGSLG